MKALRSLIFLVIASLIACAQPKDADPTRDPAYTLSNCEFQFTTSNVCAHLIWEKRPTDQENGMFVLEFKNPDDGQFIDPRDQVAADLFMPSMGHGSSAVNVVKLSPGQYRVSDVHFIMRGDWEIRVQLKNGSTVLEQATMPYRY